MHRSLLLAGASVLALCAGGAAATRLPAASFSGKFNPSPTLRGANILYNQNSNYTDAGINSQNYTTGFTSYSDQAADDFVVPTGKTWRITNVDATGAYNNSSGPAISESVIFYKNKSARPGRPLRNGMFSNLNGGVGPNFSITLPGRGMKLKAGTYWVSVVVTEEFVNGGQWFWEVNSVKHGKQAMWQNPGGGFGYCQTRGAIKNCIGDGPDLMFDLRGRAK